MGLLDRILTPRASAPAAPDALALTFAPAIMRMALGGKDATTELEALATAVATLHYPEGFTDQRVFAIASEVGRMLKVRGIAGVTEALAGGLAPEPRADAIRLAILAVLLSPLGDEDDLGLLSGLAERLGMPDAEFDALYESVKPFA